MTPVLRLSGTTRRGDPPKNSKASTWASTQEPSSMLSTGRRNISREHVSTIMKPHTRRMRSVAGSSQRPSRP